MHFADMQWRASQDFSVDNHIMPCNPFWTVMQQHGMELYMAHASCMPYMAYGQGPLDMARGVSVPHPLVPPQR